jgi:hypothetical protein
MVSNMQKTKLHFLKYSLLFYIGDICCYAKCDVVLYFPPPPPPPLSKKKRGGGIFMGF